ncbi:hypothetical protein COCNU_scaffold000669G000020 [Cocos nucifera]|nr:hypothetical protein [Cocos nucifera]
MPLLQMDVKVVEMLSKGLQACKKKGTTSEGPAAREARVDASSFVAPIDAAAAIKVAITAEVVPTAKEKAIGVKDLWEKLRKEELSSTELQAALALEEEKRIKVELKVGKLKDQASKQILEVKIQAVEEFNVSSEMRDLNVAFG